MIRLTPAIIFALVLIATASFAAEPVTVDLTSAIVLAPAKASVPETRAVRMLIEEVEKRSRVRFGFAMAWPIEQPVIVVGRADQIREMLRGTDFVLPELSPTLLVFWHTDPDHTSHALGHSAPETVKSLRDADVPLTSIAILSVCNWFTQWYRADGPLTVPAIGAHVAALFLDGLRP